MSRLHERIDYKEAENLKYKLISYIIIKFYSLKIKSRLCRPSVCINHGALRLLQYPYSILLY